MADSCNSSIVHIRNQISDITRFLNLPELMISQGFVLPWDHRNASVLPIKLSTFFLDIKFGSCNNAYMLMEFQRIAKQMTTKPIVDYFQRVCDATIMHVLLTWHILNIPKHMPDLRYGITIQPESRELKISQFLADLPKVF